MYFYLYRKSCCKPIVFLKFSLMETPVLFRVKGSPIPMMEPHGPRIWGNIWSIPRTCKWLVSMVTLQETHISPYQPALLKLMFLFPKVGYVSFLEVMHINLTLLDIYSSKCQGCLHLTKTKINLKLEVSCVARV